LSKVEVFVLDEADVMIATQGHQDQSIRIHKYDFATKKTLTTYLIVIQLIPIQAITENLPDDVVFCNV